jgi:hypothetical protein
MEIYAVIRPEQSRVFLTRFQTWINTHTDEVIIIGSLLLGLWLVANSIYLIITSLPTGPARRQGGEPAHGRTQPVPGNWQL